MLRSHKAREPHLLSLRPGAREPQPLSPHALEPELRTKENTAVRSPAPQPQTSPTHGNQRGHLQRRPGNQKPIT